MSDFDWTPYEGGNSVSFSAVGDSVTGIVTDIDVKNGQHGDVPVVTLIDEAGEEREVWCGAAVLRSEMARLKPQKGDKVRVTLIEERHVGKPSPMKVFEVKVARPQTAQRVAESLAAPTPTPPAYDDGSEPF